MNKKISIYQSINRYIVIIILLILIIILLFYIQNNNIEKYNIESFKGSENCAVGLNFYSFQEIIKFDRALTSPTGVVTEINDHYNNGFITQKDNILSKYKLSSGDNFSIAFKGNFYPTMSGKWKFALGDITNQTIYNNDDASYLWIGDNALKPTRENVTGYYEHGMARQDIATYDIDLEQNKCYPLLMIYYQYGGAGCVNLGIIPPNTPLETVLATRLNNPKIYNGTPYFKHNCDCGGQTTPLSQQCQIQRLEKINFKDENFQNMNKYNKNNFAFLLLLLIIFITYFYFL